MTELTQQQLARARVEADRRREEGRWMGGRCGDWGMLARAGEPCQLPVGWGTDHPGYGPCGKHGGNRPREKAIAAWMAGTQLAGELDTTPWDALLTVLRRQARRAWWYQERLADVEDEETLLPGGPNEALLRRVEVADRDLARYAQQAIAAGVAERLVERYVAEGEIIAGIMTRVLDQLGLSDDLMTTARSMIRTELLALEAPGDPGAPAPGESRELGD